MSITYNLLITKIETENYSNFSNVVVQTWWDYTGTDETGITGTCNGRTLLTTDNIDPATFVPYEELTPEVVSVWIQNSLDDQRSLYYREFAEMQILDQINQKKKNLQEQPDLPWAPAQPDPLDPQP